MKRSKFRLIGALFLLLAQTTAYSKTFAGDSLVVILATHSAPVNDLKENAIEISNINNWCSELKAYTTVGGTVDMPGSVNSVWFKFKATTAEANIKLKTGGEFGTITHTNLTVYNSTFSQVIQKKFIQTFSISAQPINLTVGEYYYISVDNQNGGAGTFTLCIDAQVNFDSWEKANQLTNLNNWCSENGAFTTIDATPDRVKPSCMSAGTYNNIWFKFQATTNEIDIRLKRGGVEGTMGASFLTLYNSSFNDLNCNNYTRGEDIAIQNIGLTPGEFYYIMVDNSSGAAGSFTLCVNDKVSHDLKEKAVLLANLNNWCSAPAEYTTINATIDEKRGTCAYNGPNNNVWFKFQATTSEIDLRLKIYGTEGTMRYPYLTLFDAAMNQVGCTAYSTTHPSGPDMDIAVQKTNLTAGEWYYFSVDNGVNSGGTFTLCANDKVDYDLKEKAILLTNLNQWCSGEGAYTNINASADEKKGSCWYKGPSHNVWFKFQAITNEIDITVKPGANQYVALFDESMTEVGCDVFPSTGIARNLVVKKTTLIPGSWYYISVDNDLGKAGSFSLCINGVKAPSLETDSLALVSLYGSTGGATWTSKTNWLTGRLSTWQGITVSGGRVTSFSLLNNNLVNSADLTQLTALTHVNLSNNNLTKVDLSSITGLKNVYVSNNKITELKLHPDASLNIFEFANNLLTTADISRMPNLGTAYGYSNNLTSIVVNETPGYYTKLTNLRINNNKLASVNLSGMPALTILYAGENNLSSLDLSNQPALKNLYINGNQISNLILHNGLALSVFHFHQNSLTSLDISRMPDLTVLFGYSNNLSSLIVNGSNNYYSKLINLRLENNKITSLDLKGMSALQICYLQSNQLQVLNTTPTQGYYSGLTNFQIQQNKLSAIDITGMPALNNLYADNNLMTEVKTVSNSNYYSNLRDLRVNVNKLTALDISGMPSLETLYGSSNELVDFGMNSAEGYYSRLSNFQLQNNKLTALDISRLPGLTVVYVQNNSLEKLTLSPAENFYNLSAVKLENNRLSFEPIETLVGKTTNFTYSPQANFDLAFNTVNSVITASVGGINNIYQWKKNGVTISGATGSTCTVPSSNYTVGDQYQCIVTNSVATKLTLSSNPYTLPVKTLTPLQTDSLALVNLYTSAGGATWTNKTNWLTGGLGTWYGVTIVNGRVDKLSLINNNLIGTVDNTFNLSALKTLQIHTNKLTSLDISNLPAIEVLQAHTNQFSQVIANSSPNYYGKLTELHLAYNMINGIDLSNMPALKTCYLGKKSYTGSQTNQQNQNFVNLITNPAPNYYYQIDLLSLEYTALSSLNLSGMEKLKTLTANNSNLGAVDLSKLNSLTTAHLHSNKLSSVDISNLPTIEVFHAHTNQVSEVITSSTANYYSKLMELHLAYNMLEGFDISNMPALKTCYVGKKSYIGTQTNQQNDKFVRLTTNPSPNYYYQIDLLSLEYTALTSLNLTGMEKLRTLIANHSSIETADLSKLNSLATLHLFNNRISRLDISNLPLIEILYAHTNQVSQVITNPVENYYSKLVDLNLNFNMLTGFDISNMPALKICHIGKKSYTGAPVTLQNELFTTFTTNATPDYYFQIDQFAVEYTGISSLILTGMERLKKLSVNNSSLAEIDISRLPSLNTLSIQSNKLTFEDLEPLTGRGWTSFTYSPQGNVNLLFNKNSLSFSVNVGGANNIYQWRKNGVAIAGATSPNLIISEADLTANAQYQAVITNSVVTGLTLNSIVKRPGDYPVVNAGPDHTITLPTNTLTITGSGTISSGSITKYEWTKQSGPSITISGESSTTLSLSNLIEGSYVFRLTVTDNNNLTAWDEVGVSVQKSAHTPLQLDSLALVDLYNSTAKPGWINKTNWLTGRLSTWFGVTVSGGRVISLNLSSNNLTGEITFKALDALGIVNLHYNKISRMNIETLSGLKELRVYGNGLLEINTKNTVNAYPELYYFLAQTNELVSIDITGMPRLGRVEFTNNKLTTIKTCAIENYYNSLTIFYANNNLGESIDISNMPILQDFRMGDNQLVTIKTNPNERYYSRLTSLVLGKNKIRYLNIVGMPELVTLYAGTNHIEELVTSSSKNYYYQLGIFEAQGNKIKSLDINGMPALGRLWVHVNELQTLTAATQENYYPMLKVLDINNNQLTSLNTNGMPALVKLSVQANLLQELITNPKDGYYHELSELMIHQNKLTSIDLTGMPALKICYAYNNLLTEIKTSGAENYYYQFDEFRATGNNFPFLDISGMPVIRVLQINSNQIQQLKTNNLPNYYTQLLSLQVQGNKLTSLDIGNMPALKTLLANSNLLTEVIVNTEDNYYPAFSNFQAHANSITSLNIKGMPALETLYLYTNKLTSLVTNTNTPNYYSKLSDCRIYSNLLSFFDIGNMPALKVFFIQTNQLTELITKATEGYYPDLTNFQANNNKLVSLDIQGMPSLQYCYVYGNQLSTLKTNQSSAYYSAISDFRIYGNAITSLNISNMPALKALLAHDNKLVEIISSSTDYSFNDLRLQSNNLTFQYLEPLKGKAVAFTYSPQANVNLYFDRRNLTFSVLVGGANNIYQWKKNGVVISGATSTNLVITEADFIANASYQCLTTNSVVTGLTISSTTKRPGDYPVANAGPDQTITLPTNTLTLTGSGTVQNGTIAKYEWSKKSGATVTMSGENTPALSLSNLIEGGYVFRLTVTDNSNFSDWDEIEVIVKRSPLTPLQSDSLALVEFYNSTDGANWKNKTNWLTGRLSTWNGVGIKNGRVVSISLIENNLIGEAILSPLTAITGISLQKNKLTKLDLSGAELLNTLTINNNAIADLVLHPNASLTSIICNNNQLTSIDFSKMSQLTYIAGHINKISNIVINETPGFYSGLTGMNLGYNQITSINLTGMPSLTNLNLEVNKLNELNLSNQAALTILSINKNSITNLTLHPSVSLTKFEFNDNQIATIDLSRMPNLNFVNGQINKLTSVILNETPGFYTNLATLNLGYNQLASINLEGMVGLSNLNLEANKFVSLNLSSLPTLKFLYVNNNLLNELILNSSLSLSKFEFQVNQLTSIDISRMPDLNSISGNVNKLTSIAINETPGFYSNLTSLDLSINQISSINLTGMPVLSSFYIHRNNLSSLIINPNSKFATVKVETNRLAFDALESFVGKTTTFTYSPQSNVNLFFNRSTLEFSVVVGGANNVYEWKRNGVVILGATSSNLAITEAELTANAQYQCLITNTLVTGLTISSLIKRPQDFPVANAGPDHTITLPANTLTIKGTGTVQSGSITRYEWTKESGPELAMSGENTSTLSLSNLVQGSYVFRLTITDNNNQSGWDEVIVTVKKIVLTPLDLDSLSLVDIYNNNNGINWTSQANWLKGLLSTWHGVSIRDGRVRKLILPDNKVLGSVSLGNLTKLEGLNLSLNGVTALDLTKQLDLTEITLSGNQLVNFDISSLPKLVTLDLANNSLTAVTTNSTAAYYPNLKTVSAFNNQLTSMVLAGMPALTVLNLNTNQLATLDVSKQTNLTVLSVNQNKLKALAVRPNTLLSTLYASENELKTLDVSTLLNLERIDISKDLLTSITFNSTKKYYKKLKSVKLNNNSLIAINVLNGAPVDTLHLHNNAFTFEDLEPFAGNAYNSFLYSPQSVVNLNFDLGTATFSVAVGGTANTYQWYRNGVTVKGATANALKITDLDYTSLANFRCETKNSLITGLTILSAEKAAQTETCPCTIPAGVTGYQNCIVVTKATDPTVINSTGCEGSLRWALLKANLLSGGTYIRFNMPTNTPAITLKSSLPDMVKPIYIEGVGKSGATSKISIVAGGVPTYKGVTLKAGASGSSINNLAFYSFVLPAVVVEAGSTSLRGNFFSNSEAGISISNAQNTRIGGNSASQNVFHFVKRSISLSGADNTIIKGNIIGAPGNLNLVNQQHGIYMVSSRNVIIGSAVSGEGNSISGQSASALYGENLTGLVVQGNKLGVDNANKPSIKNNNVATLLGANNSVIGGLGAKSNWMYFENEGLNLSNGLNNVLYGNTFKRVPESGGKNINLNYGSRTVSPANRSKPVPIIQSSSISGSNLVLRGTAEREDSVFFYLSDKFGKDAELLNYLAIAGKDLNWSISIPMMDLQDGYLIVTASDKFYNTSEFGTMALVNNCPATKPTFTVGLCPGLPVDISQPVPLTITNYLPGFYYEWDINNDGEIDTITRRPSIDHSFSVEGLSTIRVNRRFANCSVASNPEAINMVSLKIDGLSEICNAQEVTLTAIPSDLNPDDYTWYRNGEIISGAYGNSVNINSAGNYSVKFRSFTCNPNATGSINVYSAEHMFASIETGRSFGTLGGDRTQGTARILIFEKECFTRVGCEQCISPLNMKVGQTYIVSAWAREQHEDSEGPVFNYSEAGIKLQFFVSEGGNPVPGEGGGFVQNLRTKGEIIDGWQRIEGEITPPAGNVGVSIVLVSSPERDIYYDDLRIHPFNSNLKSYVYDPSTLRLMAEIDENNYATFYEYDQEGKLIRIKKETERGIMTIQESRDNIIKK